MITVDLTSSPDMPITSAWWLSAASRIAVIGCLIPRLTTSYPLLDRMMSTTFLPSSSVSLMIASADRPDARAESRSSVRPTRSPSMMRRLSRSSSGSAASSSARDAASARASRAEELAALPLDERLKRRRGVDPLEHLDEPLERVIAVPPPVVDHVQRDLPLLRRDLGHRQDLRRVHDRRGQPGLHALVQEDRVEHMARGRV